MQAEFDSITRIYYDNGRAVAFETPSGNIVVSSDFIMITNKLFPWIRPDENCFVDIMHRNSELFKNNIDFILERLL